MIYHLLPEWETFSTYTGGAVARDIANMMLLDPKRMVVCKDADDSWGIERNRMMIIPGLRPYSRILGRSILPSFVTDSYFKHIFNSLLSNLTRGDLVWCHNQPFFCTALEHSIHRRGAELVYHVHSSPLFPGARSLFKSFKADAYVFVSNAMRKEAQREYPWLSNAYVIHNGADDALFYPATDKNTTEERPTILYVGRLHPEKGAHVLLEAMRILQEHDVNAHCKIVGSAYAGGSKMTAYVRELHKICPSNVEFVNFIPARDIAQEFRRADILCCPSTYQEPFGNVVIEAMACGIPVVASRVGGIPEIAAEGGVKLVEPGCVDELAVELEVLLGDAKRRKAMAAEGIRSFQKRFTWRAAMEQYRKVASDLWSPKACQLQFR